MLRLYKEIKNITCDENSVSGDLIIGASESLSIYRLGKIFKEYKERFPEVNLIITLKHNLFIIRVKIYLLR